MYKAIEIAYFLVYYAHKTETETYLNGLKIDSLLFMLQGIHLTIYDTPLFNDPILKNSYGVYIEETYNEFFRQYASLHIPKYHRVLNEFWALVCDCPNPYYDSYYTDKSGERFWIAEYKCERIDDETKKLIEAFYDEYHKFSSTNFNEIIRNHACYQLSDKHIDLQLMKQEFKNKIQ